MARSGFPEWDNTSGLPTGTDLNKIKSTGIFDVISAQNGPSGVSSMYLQVMSTSQATPHYQNVIQRAYPHDGSSGFVRFFNGSVWSAWVADSPTAASNSLGATGHYYVDGTNGSDNNSGRTADKAWKTLTKAGIVLSTVEANGDGQIILNVLPGTYSESLPFYHKISSAFKGGNRHLIIQSAFPSNITTAAGVILNGGINIRGGSKDFSVTVQGITYDSLTVNHVDEVSVYYCIGTGINGFGQFTECENVFVSNSTYTRASANFLASVIGGTAALCWFNLNQITFPQVTDFTEAVVKLSNWVYYSAGSNHTGTVTGKQYSREWNSHTPRPVYHASLNSLTGNNVFSNYLGNLPPTVNVGNRKVSGFIKGFATGDSVRVVLPQSANARLLKAKLFLSGAATVTAQWQRNGTAFGTNAVLTQGGSDTQTFDMVFRGGTDPVNLSIQAQTTGSQGVLQYELLFEDLAPDYSVFFG